MTVNLAWRDAMTQAGGEFTAAEQAEGWPQTMKPGQLARLQRPYKNADRAGRAAAAALRDTLLNDCATGEIEHSTTTERIQTAPQVRRTISPGIASHDWETRGFETANYEHRSFLGGTLRTSYTQPAQYKDVTRHHIAAPAFAAWLTAQGMEPSPHVDAWFKARGVGCAPAGESIEKRNARWLLKWDAECPTHSPGSQARAIAAIVAAEGVTPATAKRGLQDANKARAESYRAGGVHPIKQGKNTANDPFNTVKKRSSKSR